VRAALGDGQRPIQVVGADEGVAAELGAVDFAWSFTPVIVEWERGDFADELVEVSHEQAEKIIGYFRGRWGPYGQPLDP
jgi:hypothetical protein